MPNLIILAIGCFCAGFWAAWKMAKSIQRDRERFERERKSMQTGNEFSGYFKDVNEIEKIYELVLKVRGKESEAVKN